MPDERASAGDSIIEHRWWVDTGKVRQPQHRDGTSTLTRVNERVALAPGARGLIIDSGHLDTQQPQAV
jgi:hypothetical protein